MITVLPATLTAAEARALVDSINAKACEMGNLLLELKSRDGWRALGYATWSDCLAHEFAFSRKHLYELMRAAPVVERLSPMGYTLNTSQANALARYPVDLQAPIVQATAARYGKLTESRLTRVGDVLTQAVTTGHVDADGEHPAALDAALALEDREARLRQDEAIGPRVLPFECECDVTPDGVVTLRRVPGVRVRVLVQAA